MSQSLLDDLSASIGELRGFMVQQQAKNERILLELRNVAEALTRSGELSATFIEYRNVLHERFTRIADQMGDIDHDAEKLERRVTHNEAVQEDIIKQLADWTGSFRTSVAVAVIAASLVGSVLGYIAPLLLKAIVKI